ncbi:MAG: type VI secretion system baseplate subunit TssE [Planctomycetota bacterium]
MPRNRGEAGPRVSLLDLLTGTQEDRERAHSLNAIRESARRNVERILNGRWRPTVHPRESDKKLRSSIACFGLADVTGMPLQTSESIVELVHGVQQALILHEPRLDEKSLRVKDMSRRAEGTTQREVSLVITARLRDDPMGLPVQFRSTLELPSRRFKVVHDS